MLTLRSFYTFLTFLAIVALISAERGWWKSASFYQIYPRSFKDSNGDGIGDLKGITENIPYLREIGVTAAWLSPIFTSPMIDFGYDIANFTEIDPMFGNMDDFEKLVARANAVGVKIILDFVPNHSSDECDWFVRSAAGDPEYKDFYIWHTGKVVNGIRHPPSNWISLFRGSTWTWHESRQAYYLHQFHRKQPDLNYRNPKVVERMKDVMRFWLRKGIAGFRVDAIPFIYEARPDADGNYPDEPRNYDYADTENYMSLQHIYTSHLHENHELCYDLRDVMTEMDKELGGDDRILLTEAYAPLDNVMQYYGNETRDGAQIPFNFELLSNIWKDTNSYTYAEVVHRWMDNMPKGRTANWVIGNHDQHRVATRLGADRIDAMHILVQTLPGASVTYQGEEIGMADVKISWEDTVDPQACQASPAELEHTSRDPERTPFQWDDSKNAGFSNGNSTWLPMSPDYKLVNVDRQRRIVQSHLNVYKQLKTLREERTFREGELEVKTFGPNVFAYKRFLAGEQTYVIVMNLNDYIESVNLNVAFNGLTTQLKYVIVNDMSPRRKNDLTFADSLLLMPKEAVILSNN